MYKTKKSKHTVDIDTLKLFQQVVHTRTSRSFRENEFSFRFIASIYVGFQKRSTLYYVFSISKHYLLGKSLSKISFLSILIFYFLFIHSPPLFGPTEVINCLERPRVLISHAVGNIKRLAHLRNEEKVLPYKCTYTFFFFLTFYLSMQVVSRHFVIIQCLSSSHQF